MPTNRNRVKNVSKPCHTRARDPCLTPVSDISVFLMFLTLSDTRLDVFGIEGVDITTKTPA